MLKSIFRPILWVIMLPIKIIMLPFTLAGAIQKVMIGVFLLVINRRNRGHCAVGGVNGIALPEADSPSTIMWNREYEMHNPNHRRSEDFTYVVPQPRTMPKRQQQT